MVTQLLPRKIVRRLGFRAAMRRFAGLNTASSKSAGSNSANSNAATRHTAGWHIAMLVAALGLVLRALVPAGFMPDPRALQDGHIELTLCSPGSASVGRAISLSLSSDDTLSAASASHPTDPLATSVDCPFGLMAAQVLIVPPAIGVAAMASTATLAQRLLAPRFTSRPVQGPPLGPRAPPAAA